MFTVRMISLLGVLSVPVHAQNPQRDVSQLVIPRDQASKAVAPASSQVKVSLSSSNQTLESAILEVARQAQMTVTYDSKLDVLSRRVSVRLKDVSAEEAIVALLKGTGVTARFVPNTQSIVLGTPAKARASSDASNKQGTGMITGRVTDSATQQGIAGASVTIPGVKQAAVTSRTGEFSIPGVPAGEALVAVKAFGYKGVSKSVVVSDGGRHSVSFLMVSVPTTLSGVVTTATGVQDRRAVGNDITVLNADSIMKIARVTSVTDLLETRVPGLTVIRSSGIPGAPARIRLRGIGGGLVHAAMNTSNDPIVFVDGIRVYASQSTVRDGGIAQSKLTDPMVPSALDQIDPNSIETIEVFKGASATSQWGSDAGNGVIVITTKRGKAGSTRVTGAFSAGIERMPGQYAEPGYYRFGHSHSNMSSKMCLYGDAFSDETCAVEDSTVRFQALDNPDFSPFGTGNSQTASGTVSGGTNAVTYAFTASTARELGYLQMPRFYEELYRSVYKTRAPGWMRRPTGLSSWAVNTSVIAAPKPSIRMGLNTSITVSNADRASGQELLGNLSGMYIDTFSLKFLPKLGDASLSRFVERSQARSETSSLAGTVDWMPWAWMPVHATLGLNAINRVERVKVPYGLGTLSNDDTLGSFSIGRSQSLMQSGSLSTMAWQGRRVSTALGLQFANVTTHDFSTGTDTLLPGVDEPSYFKKSTQSTFASTTAGWYFEPKLNLNSRFFAAPGFRLDGGSASRGSGRNGGLMGFFPKFNFSWIAIDREQAPLGGVVSMLRPRLGFGVAGVQPDPTWKLRLQEEGGGRMFQMPNMDGVFLGTFGNTSLRPERSREIEGGFDADLWGGRASVTVSAYAKVRADAIQNVALPSSVYGGAGKTAYYRNIGTVRNTGTELTVNARVIETNMVAWSVNASLSTNKNIVVSLDDKAIELDKHDGTRLVEGYPLSGRWGRPILGYTVPVTGRLTASDVVLGDSAVYLGSGFPKWQLPFQTTVSFWSGTASITAGFDYKSGLTQFNSGSLKRILSTLSNPNASYWEQAAALMAAMNPTGACADGRGGCAGSTPSKGTIYGMVHQVSSLRFNTFSVNYNVPRSTSSRFRLPQTSIALQGSNLGLWTNYRGKDPDVNSSSRITEIVSDDGAPPPPRTWVVRITLSS